ncbi:hypothetical protein [Magnetospirillum moscoviense]|uniref:Secreted protein n=1 Tax=Magnetospirillum moscoviense TaxID=1437059 RepID=A0A178MYP1_9PROT|nr:hypothetical protein [Magnetospirillum moscoviense]OAN58033.1 hypothetical protein A6A05_07635 [Magnetospirillum moscoviense]
MKRIAALLSLCVVLSACAVVDLAAHGVKEYERSRGENGAPPEDDLQARSQAAQPVSAQRVPVVEPAAEPTQPVPPRESVNVESLK